MIKIELLSETNFCIDSEEMIIFYRAMGSEWASSPIKEIAEGEPFDIQMICPVKD